MKCDLLDDDPWAITEIRAPDFSAAQVAAPAATQDSALTDEDPARVDDGSWSITTVTAEDVRAAWATAPAEARSKSVTKKSTSPKPLRPAYLTAPEVQKVYDAMSYAMWKDGVVMNSHVIIMWSMMGLSEAEGDKILHDYLEKARHWCKVGTKPRQRRVANMRVGRKLRYVWVHENDFGRGFHSHILLYLPDGACKRFEAWSREALTHVVGKPFPKEAFCLRPNRGKTERGRVGVAWTWFRYLSKQLRRDSKIYWRDSETGIHEAWAREVIKPWRIRESPPIPLKHLTGVSRNMHVGARRNDRYVSRWDACLFDEFYSGNEMSEWRQRVEYERRQKNYQELITTLQI
ncbi:hypothetical protein QA633_02880 [Bradyrhizobium barranii]|uniref:hypothetical protein n=1 Tax=Bradyrhizobium barranii TaxID=2992140 RepID=UPI0024B21E13|nr:hypothetical protein [Bradyrhizobium barranii]WFT96080.1 hypothetical protein QA633_02880 [Bradyrhizobium barranii]